MKLPDTDSQQNRPIETEAADRLDRGPFVDNLIRALIVDETDERGEVTGRHGTGHVVGLTGSWGSGKSSVLNLVERKLDSMDHVIVATFNPWLFHGRDELVLGFLQSLRGAVGSQEHLKSILSALDRYWGALTLAGHGAAAVADLAFTGGAASPIFSVWASRLRGAFCKPEPTTIDHERALLEAALVDAKCAFVVLIDELDRVEDDEVRAVAQLIKAVGEIRGISYLVAYDHRRVAQALSRSDSQNNYESGERYIEKIIQHAIPLRPLFAEDVKTLLNAELSESRLFDGVPNNEAQCNIFDTIVSKIETPREIRRLCSIFAVLNQLIDDEICPYDVLAYSWLLSKEPNIQYVLTKKIDELVSDPSPVGMSKMVTRSLSGEPELEIEGILGGEFNSQIDILQILFPSQVDESDPRSGLRLHRRRNLVRMLYLGNPPGQIKLSDIRDLWAKNDIVEIESKIKEMIAENRFTDFLDKLFDYVGAISEQGDKTFWQATARALRRNNDWMVAPEPYRGIADHAETVLLRYGSQSDATKKRFKRIISYLRSDRDLILLPAVLRKQLFAHGLTVERNDSSGRGVLTRNETTALIEKEIPRYRDAIINGSVLKRVPNPDVIYVLDNLGQWDRDLREALTSQLDNIEALVTFAMLIVPPGVIAYRGLFEKLIDADAVARKMEKVIETDGLPSEPAFQQSLTVLQNILNGVSPHRA